MRKWFCIGMLLLCRLLAAGEVETRIATLQHQGKSSYFFGENAYKDAYKASVSGDSIILSADTFKAVDAVSKSVKVIGKSRGVTCIASYTCVLADDVYFEGVLFTSYLYLSQINRCTFRRCYLSSLDSMSGAVHTHTLVDQCYLSYERSIDHSANCVIRNSYVNRFCSLNTPANMASITNCWLPYYYQRQDSSSTNFNRYKQPYAVYRDNVLCLDAYARDSPERPFNSSLDFVFVAPSQFYYNYIYRINRYGSSSANPAYYIHYTFEPGCVTEGNRVNLESASAIYNSSISLYEWRDSCYRSMSTTERTNMVYVTGSDGKPVGVTGGKGYAYYPGIPRTITINSYSITDLNGEWRISSLSVKGERAQPEDNPSVARIEYWVDDLSGEKTVIPIEERPGADDTVKISLTFDFSALPAGKHVFYYRLQDTKGAYSPVMVRTFTRRNPYDNELYLPYDATGPTGDQQTANPIYSAYPTEIESKMPPLQCN